MKYLKLVVFFSLCLLIVGCSKSTEHKKEVEKPKKEKIIDASPFLNQSVLIKEDSFLYTDDGEAILSVVVATEFTCSDIVNGELINIKDTNWYVNAKDISVIQPTYKSQNHLQVIGQVTIKKKAVLKDKDLQEKMTLLNEQTLPCVIQSDTQLGLLIQGNIYFTDKTNSTTTLPPIQNTMNVPVLMYHFFYNEDLGETRKDTNFVEVKEFREQLQYLRDNNYTVLTMSELNYYLNNQATLPERSVVISIDDGAPSVYQHAYPVLKEFGMNATLFLITGWYGDTLPNQFREMEANGIELQSHSNNMHEGGCNEQHGGKILCTPVNEGVQDIEHSRALINNDVFVFCYPFGDNNDNSTAILQQANIKLAFTTQYGSVNPNMDKLKLPRIRIFGGAGIERFKAGLLQ